MREQLIALYELQKIDSDAFEREKSAEAIPRKIQSLENELEELRLDLGKLRSEAEIRRKEQQELEGQIQEEAGKHGKWKRRLNEIQSAREYQALSREVEIGERQVKEFEETVLSIMQELEESQKVINEKQSHLDDREVVVGGQIRELRAKQGGLSNEAERISKGREELLGRIPKPVLSRYDRVRKARDGLGVSMVSGQICSACNVQIRPQVLITLLRFTSMEQCQNCHRLLLHPKLIESEETN